MQDSNFDIEQELKALSKKQVAEESLSNISDLFSLGNKVIFGNLFIVAIYIALKLIGLGYEAKLIHIEIDFMTLWAELSNANEAYIQDLAMRILNVLWISLLYIIGFIAFDNIIFSAICAKRNDPFGDKISAIMTMLFTKILPITLLVVMKSLIIGIGFMFFLLPGIYFWMIFILAEYVCIFENKGVFASLSRSAELMVGCKGNFLTFISIASLLLVIITAFKSFYNFNNLSYDLLTGLHIDFVTYSIATFFEFISQLVIGIYFAGCCFIYFKRSTLVKSS